MARARRFDRDRAEARRRYRAAQAAERVGVGDDVESPVADEPPATAPRPTTTPAPGRRATLRASQPRPGAQPQGRLSLGAAFRAAFRPAHYREDLRELPRLIVHRSVWVPIALAIASLLLLLTVGPLSLVLVAFQSFLLPPALAPIFITGFFAPRASYLLGGLVSLACSVIYSLTFVLVERKLIPGWPAEAVLPVSIAEAFTLGPAMGVFAGAAAAWYRRFLYSMNPARGGARQGSGTSRRSGSTAGRSGTRRR